MKILTNVLITVIISMLCLNLFSEKVGMLKFYKGEVMVKACPDSKWTKPDYNMKLDEKCIIRTGKNGEAQIKLKDGSLYRIPSNTTIEINTIKAKAKSLRKASLLSRLNLLRSKLGKGKTLAKGTPTAVAGVRGADVSKESFNIKPSELIWEE